ncbi:hypothetical protein DPMN_164228 [Dreissena polymorpha]|uniref:Uncharacterized protein n=1 Tax=Dreissena polymorpha TaxID=45954 RepID=A0A9D4IS58_DREPO|nr:hypothetical protein DPMN_164228 [Dreissena polymorpha]
MVEVRDQAAANLTDREMFIKRNCAFLHKEVKPRKGQPLRNMPLTHKTLANQPPKAQPSASTSISRNTHPHSPSTSSGRIATSPRLSITASSSSLSLSTSLSTSSNCRHPEAASHPPPQGPPAQDSCQTCRSFTPLTKLT